jgi:intracellular multiplication protein IcmO
MANENVVYENVQERLVKPKKYNFLNLYKESGLIRNGMFIIILLGFGALLLSLVTNIDTTLLHYFIYLGLSFALLGAFGLFVNTHNENKNENIVENEKNNRYLISLGTEIKKFYGDAKKSSFKKNVIRPLLFTAEKIKRHMMIVATIGAGKTVLMKGLAQQQLILGGGMFLIDGKGTTEFAKEMFALCKRYGREKDFIYINFLDPENSNSINPLKNGSVNSLYEILIALLIGEENEWKAKQKEFMKNILKLCVHKRDHEKVNLNFKVLSQYMTLPKLVDEALLYKDQIHITVIADFVKFVSSSVGISYDEFIQAPLQIDQNVDKSIYPKGKVIENEFVQKVYKNAANTQLQGVYDVSMSASAWRSVITTLGSDYRSIFNQDDPDISFWEIVQHNKVLFVTLPTMDSDTTPKELGRLMLGLLKGVAAQKAADAIEPKLPFLAMFDEIGSYIIEGFGRLMSKSRSLGICIVPIFQSFSQIDSVDNGRGLETKEMLDVTGTLVVMKTTSADVTEQINKKLKNKKYIDRAYSERRSASGVLNSSADEQFSVQKEDAIKHHEIEKMNNGEMLVITDGEMYKAVASAESSLVQKGKKVIYKQKDLTAKVPLVQYMNKEAFMDEINRTKISKKYD